MVAKCLPFCLNLFDVLPEFGSQKTWVWSSKIGNVYIFGSQSEKFRKRTNLGVELIEGLKSYVKE